MKQYLFLIFLTMFCSFASLWWTPYAGVALYYLFAILRPQYLWEWQLQYMPIRLPWSFIVASSAIGGYLLWSAGILSFGRREASLMRYRPKFTIAHYLMMLFAFWVSMSHFTAKNPDLGELWYGEYLKIFGMYYLASRVVRTPKQIWGLYMLIICAIGYIAIEMNHIYITTGKLILAKRGFAGLDNNGAALMLCLGVPLCYFAWEFTVKWYRWCFLLLIPVIMHAVLSTYSRGAMISMLMAAPVFMLFSQKRRFLLLVYLGIAVMLPFMAGKEIQDRFFSVEQREMDDSYRSRLVSWGIAWDIALEYPIFGVGVRNSNAEMFERGADMIGRTIHSQYFQIAADSGLSAMIIYLGVLASTFYCILRASIRVWNRTDFESRRVRAMLGGITCSLISFVIGAVALSLEVFEVAYLLLFLGAQVWALLNATDTLQPDRRAMATRRPTVVQTRVTTNPRPTPTRPGPAPQPANAR
ncbi:O-antigen ligase family protein [Limnoglobus roseus]|uniref:O-antigen ligase n=1 Tax=Limnoglobus roseus TaxID=2598579 RepID=A0A5C1AB85_9BACT|nr:O-antigen ligase family protein [Limnoglobus roseus]QEL15433.1 O-antigen ligase [Limnoglobus roseus]